MQAPGGALVFAWKGQAPGRRSCREHGWLEAPRALLVKGIGFQMSGQCPGAGGSSAPCWSESVLPPGADPDTFRASPWAAGILPPRISVSPRDPPLLRVASIQQSLSHVRLFVTPWTAARQASLSITNSWSILKLMSVESVMPSNHLIICRPLLSPSIF